MQRTDVGRHQLDAFGRHAFGDAGAKEPEAFIGGVDPELGRGQLARHLEAALAEREKAAPARSERQHHGHQLREHG